MIHKGPRPVAWADLDFEQRACLQTISAASEKRRDADLLAWSEAHRARSLDIPERLVTERLNVSRSTLQRQLNERYPTPSDEEPSPATAASKQPPTEPVQDTDLRNDQGIDPFPTQQSPLQPAQDTDPQEDHGIDPAPTQQLLAGKETDIRSQGRAIDAAVAGHPPTLADDIDAMPYEDVTAYLNALSDEDYGALADFVNDRELPDYYDEERMYRFAVQLHRLHVES